MKLEDLGYNNKLEKFRIEKNLQDFEIGKVVSEHKEGYIVKTQKGELKAEITGNLRFSSNNREDFPDVGDWVALTEFSTGFSDFLKIVNSKIAPTPMRLVVQFLRPLKKKKSTKLPTKIT